MAVLDTSALLNWPIERCQGQMVSILQQTELSRVDEQRWMLIESLDLDWRTASLEERQVVLEVAAKTGDLPRLSDVDIDLIAIAIANNTNLVTDDYRMKNVAREAGIEVEGVMTTGGKKQWNWILRCIGCRQTEEVSSKAHRSKKDDVKVCDRCGSPMKLKRA
ncbi:MAG: NOB1 family endonuclease [Candidatus Poseidoniaceae archaeon]